MTAAMGEDSMIFAAIYIGIFNIYIWSHGVMLLRRDGRIRWKEILLSPGVLGASLGVLLYLLQIRLPGLLLDTLGFLSGMNTPLPMVITGVLIADLAVGETLRDLRLYFTAFVRLVGLAARHARAHAARGGAGLVRRRAHRRARHGHLGELPGGDLHRHDAHPLRRGRAVRRQARRAVDAAFDLYHPGRRLARAVGDVPGELLKKVPRPPSKRLIQAGPRRPPHARP